MSVCIHCRKHLPGPDGYTICLPCASELIDHCATNAEICALAKVGMDALVDEATGYQKIRPRFDLQERLRKYHQKRLAIFSEIEARLTEGKQ